jgi:1-deoxy-D-xylulose-5-phosphate synthase
MAEAAAGAAERLVAAGVEATVWDPRVVRPPDPVLVADAARHQVVVTVEDGVALGGAGAFLGAAVTGDAAAAGRVAPALTHLGTPVGFLDHGPPGELLAGLGLDADGVAAATLDACARAGVATGPGPDGDAGAGE